MIPQGFLETQRLTAGGTVFPIRVCAAGSRQGGSPRPSSPDPRPENKTISRASSWADFSLNARHHGPTPSCFRGPFRILQATNTEACSEKRHPKNCCWQPTGRRWAAGGPGGLFLWVGGREGKSPIRSHSSLSEQREHAFLIN